MQDFYKNTRDYSSKKNYKIPSVSDNMIAVIIKAFKTPTEFIYGRTLNISIVFITQCFLVSKRH